MTQQMDDAADSTLTLSELRFCEAIREKDRKLRRFLDNTGFPTIFDAREWLTYLTGIKIALGNLNNDLGFVATVLVKRYLDRRFGIVDFDAAGKPQGASGVDIEASTPEGRRIVGELKTTKPYQPGFGAAQRTSIIKDLARLAASTADHRFMFVVDVDAYSALCRPAFAGRAPGVEIVDLVSGKTFICPAA
jgi:hypothetical protein